MSFHLRPQETLSLFSPDFHETHQYLTALRSDFTHQISSKSTSRYRIPLSSPSIVRISTQRSSTNGYC
jgi:hypothetical protein